MREGFLQLIPTSERVDKVSAKLSSFLSDDFIDEDDLSSMHGDVVFLSCISFSKCISGGLKLLSASNIGPNNRLLPSRKLGTLYFFSGFA